MGKYSKYFLSLGITTSILFACDERKELKQEWDEASLLEQRKYYYQGSLFKQENSDRLIELQPEKASYYQGKSMTHTKIGDFHIAFPLLEKAYSLDPKETGYYYGWLLLYYYRDYERAIEKLKEFDDFTPDQPDFAWGEHVNFLKGLCYKQMGDYKKAIEEFNTVITMEAGFVDVYAYVYRGIAQQRLGAHEEAISDFDKAIEEYQQNSMAFYYKGLSLSEQGKEIEAKEAYREALRLLQQGYLYRDPYHEAFDGISITMVEDQLKSFTKDAANSTL
jgi:tetratricopeptide (TPR) repeat protein